MFFDIDTRHIHVTCHVIKQPKKIYIYSSHCKSRNGCKIQRVKPKDIPVLSQSRHICDATYESHVFMSRGIKHDIIQLTVDD